MFYFNTLCCYHKISLTKRKENVSSVREQMLKKTRKKGVCLCVHMCVVFEKACELGREGQRLNRKECV